MQYRHVSKSNGDFAEWLHDLRNLSGVYVIRSAAGVLYVGESHSGALAKTIKRHFWPWKDDDERIHHTYQRGRCTVAVITCPPSAAVGLQNKLIAKLSPRDNRQQLDAAPF